MSASDEFGGDSDHAADQSVGWLKSLYWVGLWLASVTVAIIVVSGFVMLLRATSTPAQADIDGWLWSSRDQKCAEMREAYNGRRPVVVDARKEAIKAFLEGLTKPITDGESAKWKQSIDKDRFRDRVLSSPFVKSLSLIDRRLVAMRKFDEFTIQVPDQFDRIEIVRIIPWGAGFGKSARSDEVLVFTYAHRQFDEGEPLLFWIRQSAEVWKLVDWETVDSGSSEAEIAATWESAMRDKMYPYCETANAHIQRADQMTSLGSQAEGYERELFRVEECPVPHELRERYRYFVTNRLSSRFRDAAVLRYLGSPDDRIPGIAVCRALAYQRLGDMSRALSVVDQVEKMIGFRPSLAKQRARMLRQLNRREESLAEWRRLADFDPDDVMSLNELYKQLPKSQRPEVIERIKASKKSTELALQFIQFDMTPTRSETLQILADFVKTTAPDSHEAFQIETLRLANKGDHKAAAALYRAAIDRETDSEKQRSLWDNYFYEMNQAGDLSAAFAEHPDPKSVFRTLVNGTEDDGPMFEVEELQPVLAAYREKQPDDPWSLYYEGFAASQQYRFADADRSLTAAEKLLSEQKPTTAAKPAKPADEAGKDGTVDDVEIIRDSIRRLRCVVGFELGNDVDLLVQYRYEDSVYRKLAGLAVQYRRWHVLYRLNRSYENAKPSDPWPLYYDAQVLLAAKKFAAATDKLRALARRENDDPSLKYFRTQLQQDLVVAQNPDPLRALSESTERTVTFERLTRKLLAEADWPMLDRLCEQYGAVPDDFNVTLVRMRQAWRQGDDVKLTELLTPWPTGMQARHSYLEPLWRERLVRSLLRLDRISDASAIAQDANDRLEQPWPLVITYIAKHRASEITRMLNDDESFVQQWAEKDVEADPGLRPILQDEEFADIRTGLVFACPDFRYCESLALLLRKPIELSQSWLSEQLVNGEADSEMAPQIAQVSSSIFIVNWKGSRFAIISSSQPYLGAAQLNNLTKGDRELDLTPKLKQMLTDQQAFCEIINLSSPLFQLDDSPDMRAREFGAKLFTADVVGVIETSKHAGLGDVIALNETQSEMLASRRSFPELDSTAVTLNVRSGEKRRDPETIGRLKKLSPVELAKSPLPAARIVVQLCDTHTPLTAEFAVREIRCNRYGNHQLIAEYTAEQPYPGIPELRRGTRFVVNLDQVTQVLVSP